MAPYIVIWIICGGLSAMIASNNGRSGLQWFVIGVVLGPLGVLVSLIMGRSDSAKEEQAMQRGEAKKCPFCAETVKAEAVVCKHCGGNLQAAEANESNALVATGLKGRHQALQDAIAAGEVEAARAILKSGLVLSENPLPISHLEYAEMYGNSEMLELINSSETA